MSNHVLKIAPDSFAARIRAFIRALKDTQAQVRRKVPGARGFAILGAQ